MLKQTFLALGAGLLLSPAAWAQPQVVGTYPYITDLVKQIGGNKVEVSTLARGDWDPHFIVPKPSLISQLRRADLLIINGAQLEVGWLPPLLRQASNAQIQPGATGFLELSNYANLIQKPANTSRAMGDVHPQGNPHFFLDPYQTVTLAGAIADKLCQIDGPQCPHYRSGKAAFDKRWQAKLKEWSARMRPHTGKKVLEYHRLHDYFLQRYRLGLVQTLEPLPGIPPSPAYLNEVIANAQKDKPILNLRGSYNPMDPSRFVSQKTSVKLSTLPHDVGATPKAKDVFAVFDEIVAAFE
jgi:zinc/manganese transport system substrate-binding protein